VVTVPAPEGLSVPVTAKLSREFYDRLGEGVANELVDWLNAVDATYRADLRELNEVNFARFDAKVEQRLAEQDAKWERRISEVVVEMRTGFAALDARFDGKLSALRSDVVKWSFVFWATTALAVMGLYLR
jgi:hypothetical protein